MADDLAHSTPKGIDVLTIHGNDLETVALKGLGNIVALEVLRRVASDGDIVVVDDKLHVETLRDRQPGSLGIVSFLQSPGRVSM